MRNEHKRPPYLKIGRDCRLWFTAEEWIWLEKLGAEARVTPNVVVSDLVAKLYGDAIRQM